MLISTAESVPVRPPASSPDRTWELYRTWLVAAVLWLATMGLYWPVVHHDFIDYDDDRFVESNDTVQKGLTLGTLKWALVTPVCSNWHPLTMMSHMLDCQLYGLNPGKHHLTSLLFHAGNVVLVFFVFRRLTGTFWRSACVAALFAWHPLHVESVAWIAERKDVLSAFFGLLSLLAYAAYARDARKPARPFYQSSRYWLAWAFLALGLLSKPMLVTWPFLLLLLDFWPLQRLQLASLQPTSAAADPASPATVATATSLRHLLIEKILFFVLAAALSVLTFLVQNSTGNVRALGGLPMIERCENALISWCRYLGKTFWPVDLSIYYPYPGHWPLAWVLLSGLFLSAVSILCWRARRRQPFLLMGWCWFVGALVPVIGLVQVGSQAMADHYSYLPSLGLFASLVWAAHDYCKRWLPQIPLAAALGLLAIVACGGLTWHQLAYWQNSETLFRHALQVTADNDVARNCLGHALLRAGHTDEAIDQFRNAVRLQPDSEEAHYNLGTALAAKGQTDEAIREFNRAIECQPDQPKAYNNLAALLYARGQTNDAIRNFKMALALRPDFAVGHLKYGEFLAHCGDLPGALNETLEAERLNPGDDAIHRDLGDLFTRTGQSDAARREYTEAVRLNPGDADSLYWLGNLQARAGRQDEAIGWFQQALRSRPDFAEAHNNLGSLLFAQSHLPAAIAQFQAAVRNRPDYRNARYNLGNALLKNGQPAEAAAEYHAVLQLAPDFAAAHDQLGLALAQQGRLEEAAGEFQAALRLQPGLAEASNHLAQTRQTIGHSAKP